MYLLYALRTVWSAAQKIKDLQGIDWYLRSIFRLDAGIWPTPRSWQRTSSLALAAVVQRRENLHKVGDRFSPTSPTGGFHLRTTFDTALSPVGASSSCVQDIRCSRGHIWGEFFRSVSLATYGEVFLAPACDFFQPFCAWINGMTVPNVLRVAALLACCSGKYRRASRRPCMGNLLLCTHTWVKRPCAVCRAPLGNCGTGLKARTVCGAARKENT